MINIGPFKFAPVSFGDPESRRGYEREVDKTLARQETRYAIAPRQALVMPDGETLGPGSPVTIELLTHPDGPPAGTLLGRLLEHGVVIEATPEQVEAARSAKGARFVVAPKKALSVKGRGILAPGAGVFAEDLPPHGELRLLELCAKGVLVDREAP